MVRNKKRGTPFLGCPAFCVVQDSDVKQLVSAGQAMPSSAAMTGCMSHILFLDLFTFELFSIDIRHHPSSQDGDHLAADQTGSRRR